MEIFYMQNTSPTTYELITLNDEKCRGNVCFHCSYCNDCLSSKTYFVWGHSKYCCGCFEKLYGQKCAFCHKPITGSKRMNFIYYDQQTWHAECFKCSNCHTSFTESCFSPTHTVKCNRCGSSLKTPSTR